MINKTFLLTALIMISPVTIYAMASGDDRGVPDLPAAPAPAPVGIVLSPQKKAALVGALAFTAPVFFAPALFAKLPASNDYIGMLKNLVKLGICIGGAKAMIELAKRL
jgi:hypothetical protein